MRATGLLLIFAALTGNASASDLASRIQSARAALCSHELLGQDAVANYYKAGDLRELIPAQLEQDLYDISSAVPVHADGLAIEGEDYRAAVAFMGAIVKRLSEIHIGALNYGIEILRDLTADVRSAQVSPANAQKLVGVITPRLQTLIDFDQKLMFTAMSLFPHHSFNSDDRGTKRWVGMGQQPLGLAVEQKTRDYNQATDQYLAAIDAANRAQTSATSVGEGVLRERAAFWNHPDQADLRHNLTALLEEEHAATLAKFIPRIKPELLPQLRGLVDNVLAWQDHPGPGLDLALSLAQDELDAHLTFHMLMDRAGPLAYEAEQQIMKSNDGLEAQYESSLPRIESAANGGDNRLQAVLTQLRGVESFHPVLRDLENVLAIPAAKRQAVANLWKPEFMRDFDNLSRSIVMSRDQRAKLEKTLATQPPGSPERAMTQAKIQFFAANEIFIAFTTKWILTNAALGPKP